MKKYKGILFDLDGTLLDTSEGIFHSVRFAESKMGLEPLGENELRRFVGPPPASMYRQMYGLDEQKAEKAAFFHRQYGKEKAIYEAKVYDGVYEILQSLQQKEYKLAVATLKRKDIAEKILERYELIQYFDIIEGMNEEESLKKADIIGSIINTLGAEFQYVLVGDTSYDEEGAKQSGIDFIGVSYGFGFEGSKYCETPQKILDRIEKNEI